MAKSETGGTLSLYRKTRRPGDKALAFCIYLAAALTVCILVGIIGYILVKGVPHISWSFLSTSFSALDEGRNGILPMIINTLYIVVITLLIVTPIGIASAIYLTQYARQGKLVKTIRFTTEVLSGVPSIVFGLFGYTVFCVMMGMGYSILAGCLTMTICILPTIVRTTEESLLAVPESYKEGALALGAGKTRVVLGMAQGSTMPGILTAVILGMGRIVGESAALLFTSGIATNMPDGVLSHVMSSGRTLTLHLYQTATEATDPAAFQIAYATAAVLLILVFILNRLAGLLSRVLRKG